MSYYNCFVKRLQEELETSENIVNSYTPSNVEQAYKHNHLAIMQEVSELLIYLHNTLKDKADILRQLKLHTDNAYINEKARLKDMLPINRQARYGIAETYYNISDDLKKYISWVERYDKWAVITYLESG